MFVVTAVRAQDLLLLFSLPILTCYNVRIVRLSGEHSVQRVMTFIIVHDRIPCSSREAKLQTMRQKRAPDTSDAFPSLVHPVTGVLSSICPEPIKFLTSTFRCCTSAEEAMVIENYVSMSSRVDDYPIGGFYPH